MSVQCWPAVYDVVPALNQHWVSVSCLLGSHDTVLVICDPHRYHSPPSERQKKGYVHLFYVKTEQYIIYWTVVRANLMSWWGKFHWNARHHCPISQQVTTAQHLMLMLFKRSGYCGTRVRVGLSERLAEEDRPHSQVAGHRWQAWQIRHWLNLHFDVWGPVQISCGECLFREGLWFTHC